MHPINKNIKIFSIIKKILAVFIKIIIKILNVIFILILISGLAWWLSQKPSLYRDWEPQDAVLPEITFSGSLISIKNIRDFHWKNDKEFEVNYINETYDLNEIEKMYYLITPFSDFH